MGVLLGQPNTSLSVREAKFFTLPTVIVGGLIKRGWISSSQSQIEGL